MSTADSEKTKIRLERELRDAKNTNPERAKAIRKELYEMQNQEKKTPTTEKRSSHKGLVTIVFLALIVFCVYSMFQIMKVSMDASKLLVPVGVILLSVIILFKQFEHK